MLSQLSYAPVSVVRVWYRGDEIYNTLPPSFCQRFFQNSANFYWRFVFFQAIQGKTPGPLVSFRPRRNMLFSARGSSARREFPSPMVLRPRFSDILSRLRQPAPAELMESRACALRGIVSVYGAFHTAGLFGSGSGAFFGKRHGSDFFFGQTGERALVHGTLRGLFALRIFTYVA